MLKLSRIAAASAAMFVFGTVSAFAACDRDAGTETVLGAASGAAVGGLASHSIAGAAIGGVAGGVIGNAIGQSNNREDCRREAQYYDQGQGGYQGQGYQGQGYYEQQQTPYARQDYGRQAYQPRYDQEQDYALRLQEYERQRQAYYRRYPNASAYYGNGYGQGYDNNPYGYQSYSPSSRYSDYGR
jgi:hypothetical protein